MSILVIADLNLKPERLEDFTVFMENYLPHTRGYDGCNELTIHKNQDDPTNLVIVEDWDSRQIYEKYLVWRTERGDMEKLEPFFVGEPTIRYYDKVDV